MLGARGQHAWECRREVQTRVQAAAGLLEADVAEQSVACATPACQAECHAPAVDRGRVCHVKRKRPTDHGHPSRSAAGVLKALANRLREGADGGADPKDIIHRRGIALATAAGSESPLDHQAFSEEARIAAWSRTCGGRSLRWKGGGAGI